MTSSPCSDSLSLGLQRFFFNPATSYKSPAHSSTGTRSDIVYPPTACQLTVSCSFSLPYGGSISPFHHCTSSLSVTQEYLALRGGPRRFTRNFSGTVLLGVTTGVRVRFAYRTVTFYGASFHNASATHRIGNSLEPLLRFLLAPRPRRSIASRLCHYVGLG